MEKTTLLSGFMSAMETFKTDFRKLYECAVCFTFLTDIIFSCSICGHLLCDNCTQVIIKKCDKWIYDCPVCKNGIPMRCKFAEKILGRVLDGEKFDCFNADCTTQNLTFSEEHREHSRKCDKRLVLCPRFPIACNSLPMPISMYYETHLKDNICGHLSKSILPNEENVFKLRFTTADVNFFEKTNFPSSHVFKPIFFDPPHLRELGLHLIVKRDYAGDWHFVFHSFGSEVDCKRYKISFILYRPRSWPQDDFFDESLEMTTDDFKSLPYYEAMNPSSIYVVSRPFSPLSKYEDYTSALVIRKNMTVRHPQEKEILEARTFLKDIHIIEINTRGVLFEMQVMVTKT